MSNSIVVVDDDPLYRKLLTRSLESEGWQVQVCTTVAEAAEKLRHTEVMAVITDLRLPDGCGLELAICVRSAAGAPVLLAVSGDVETERAPAGRLGVALFDKCDLSALLRHLSRLLRVQPASIA